MKRILLTGAVVLVANSMHIVPAYADFWSKTWKELGNAGRDINREAIKIGKKLEENAQAVEREFCDIMTFGGSSRGDAGCNVSAGYGRDNQGTYTYDPNNPETKYRGNEGDKNDGPTDQKLSEMARNLQESQIKTWEYEDEDVYGIKRFLLPDTSLGEAWPDASKNVASPTKSGEIRPCCKGGAGGFLATRNDKGDLRFHAGTDYTAKVGEVIYAPVSGWVERVKAPGRPGLSGLLLVNDKGYSASVYYIDPTPEIKTALATPTKDGITKNRYEVKAGSTVIGHAQDLHPAYPADVPQHVHVTLTDPQGNPVAPDGQTRIKKTPKK